MRKYIWVVLFLAACGKHHNNPIGGTGTIHQVWHTPLTDTLLDRSAMDSIQLLCQANRISTADLQFYHFAIDIERNYLGQILDTLIAAEANVFVNGLLVYDEPANLIFISGGLWHPWSFTATTPDNDTTGHQPLSQLRQDFLGSANELNFADSTLTAMLCYVSAGFFAGPSQTLTKAWLVKGYYGFPAVLVRDEDGKVVNITPIPID